MATHLIKPITWDEETRGEKDRELCEVVGYLQRVSDEKYGSPSVKQLRSDFLTGRYVFRFDATGRQMMARLLELEDQYLAAYILQADSIAGSFHRSHQKDFPQLDREDYTQQASAVLVNAVLNYDGSTAFTTYLHSSVRREMIDYVRSNEDRAGIGRGIKKLRTVVRRIMRNEHCGFDAAVEIARQDHKISDKDKRDLAAAIYRTVGLGTDEHAVAEQTPDEIEWVRQALEQADLTDMERQLIEAFMLGENDFRRRIVETNDENGDPVYTNPTTNKRWTRQALSLAFQRGCAKLKDIMERSMEISEAA